MKFPRKNTWSLKSHIRNMALHHFGDSSSGLALLLAAQHLLANFLMVYVSVFLQNGFHFNAQAEM